MTNIVEFKSKAKVAKKGKPVPDASAMPDTVDLPVEMAISYAMAAIYHSGNVDTEIGDWLLEEACAVRERCEATLKIDRRTLMYLHEKRQARMNIEYFRLCKELNIDPD